MERGLEVLVIWSNFNLVLSNISTQPQFTSSKLTIETLE